MRQCRVCPVWIADAELLCAYHDKRASGLIGGERPPPGHRPVSEVTMNDEDRELAASLRAIGADEIMVAQAVRRNMARTGRRDLPQTG